MIHLAIEAVGLRRRDRAHALRALGWLILARTALRVCSYSTLRRAIDRVPPRGPVTAPITAIECEHALRRAVRVCPSASCLAQAIAAACLLRRDDRNSTLTIGVGFGPDHGFRAHAWVESDGVSVCGRRAAAEYRVLLRDVISRTSFDTHHA